jgi:hypothetical protein
MVCVAGRLAPASTRVVGEAVGVAVARGQARLDTAASAHQRTRPPESGAVLRPRARVATRRAVIPEAESATSNSNRPVIKP